MSEEGEGGSHPSTSVLLLSRDSPAAHDADHGEAAVSLQPWRYMGMQRPPAAAPGKPHRRASECLKEAVTAESHYGSMLEQSIPEGLHPVEGTHSGEGEEHEEEAAAAKTVCDELGLISIPCSPQLLKGRGGTFGREVDPEEQEGVEESCFSIWVYFSLLI